METTTIETTTRGPIADLSQPGNRLCKARCALTKLQTWQQTVMAELREMGLSWDEAQASAKDRTLL